MAPPDDPPAVSTAPSGSDQGKASSDEGAIDRLRRAALRGGILTLLSYGGAQVLRLASNLILTRILAPEHFGLMALVNSCMAALQMFSDLGIRVSIIQDREGDAPRFLNTAFTLSGIRGTVLWLAACALGWPLSRFYGQPELVWLLPVVGLQALAMGFHSTAQSELSRQMILGRLTALDLGTQIASIVLMIAWAVLIRPDVWALVVGGVFSSVLRVVLSHIVLPGTRNRFLWDKEVAQKLIRFGRWIFFSTILTAVADKSDRLILGAVMSIQVLGVYNIAAFLAQAVPDGLSLVSQRVLFPLYARLAEVEQGPALRRRILRTRALLLLLTLPPLCVMVAFPDLLIRLLFDARFHGGAWMFQALAGGFIVSATGLTASPVLLARGDSFRHMSVLAWRTVTLVSGLLWVTHSETGKELARTLEYPQVYVIALNPLLGYPALAWATRRHGVWMPALDLAALLASGGLIGVLVGLRMLLGV